MTTEATELKAKDVFKDGYLDGIGPDEWVAVDYRGRVLAKADSEAAAKSAAPDAVACFSGKQLTAAGVVEKHKDPFDHDENGAPGGSKRHEREKDEADKHKNQTENNPATVAKDFHATDFGAEKADPDTPIPERGEAFNESAAAAAEAGEVTSKPPSVGPSNDDPKHGAVTAERAQFGHDIDPTPAEAMGIVPEKPKDRTGGNADNARSDESRARTQRKPNR